MRIPEKKLKSGLSMPALGVGTWGFGGKYGRNPFNDDAADVRALNAALDMGVTHIDTAEMYAFGRAEELVGRAIAGRDRKRLFIVSKVCPLNFSRDRVISAAKGSLRRLGTDYLDLYLLHWPNPLVRLEETLGAMDFLVKEGLIKNIGVSNFPVGLLEKARGLSDNPIVCDQVRYSLAYRAPEQNGLLDYCQTKDVLLVAYTPLQTGKLARGEGSPALDRLCDKYGKTPAQVALNWLISQKNVVAIPKAGNPAHLKENLGSVGWKMGRKDIELLRKEFPSQQDVSDTGARK